jgi:hypothetical protein
MESGHKDYLDQYTNLVNQPTWGDEVGDAFTKAASQPAHGASQRSTNALLAGVGAGFKGSANEQRREKLSPMLEQAGRLTAEAAKIEAQTQKATQSKLQLTQFFQQTAVPIAQLSKASLANDMPAANELGKAVYMRFKQSLGDPSMGDYDHYHNGTIYYHNVETGVVEGRNIVSSMYQAGINPMEIWGQDAPAIEAGLSPGAKQNYEDSQKIRQMEMEKMRLGNELTQAHTGVYKADAAKTKHEMDNPEEPYNKEVANHNLAYIKEQRERKINAEALVATLNDLEGMLKDADKKGQAGSTLKAKASREWAKYISGDNESATLADMAKAAYFSRVKEGGGSNPSTTEFLTVLETIPNTDKNSSAALKRLKLDREQALKVMYRHKKTEEGLRKTKYQGSPDDESIFKHDDNEYKTFSEKYYKPENKVKIQAPDGTVGLVSPEFAQTLEKRGGKIINE